MENQDKHKEGWITPTIQDLDITDTKGGSFPGIIEDVFEFPGWSGSGPI